MPASQILTGGLMDTGKESNRYMANLSEGLAMLTGRQD